jgi:hypothetical protein
MGQGTDLRKETVPNIALHYHGMVNISQQLHNLYSPPIKLELSSKGKLDRQGI